MRRMPQQTVLPRLRRSQLIANELSEQIHSGHFAVGAQLPTEAALCQHYQVSRTTLREAIQMLRTNGLLNVTPGRGSFVQAPCPHTLLASTLQACAGQLGTVDTEVPYLLGAVLQQLVTRASQQTDGAALKRKVPHLQSLMLERQANGLQNAKHEALWLLHFIQLANWPLHHMLLKGLLKHQMPQRSAEFAVPDKVAQVIQVQLRVHNALLEHDWPTVQRVLGHTYPVGLPKDVNTVVPPIHAPIGKAPATLAG